MSKILKILTALTVSAFLVFFAVGCGDDGDKDGTVIPTTPPQISVADRDRQPTSGQGEGYVNATVTQSDVNEFVATFVAAILQNNYSYSASTRSLPPQREVWVGSGKGSWTVNGLVGGGRMEISVEWREEEEWTPNPGYETETGYESVAVKFFNFSNTGDLFLGGAFGLLETFDYRETETGEIENNTLKIDGKINFAGAFTGSIVFNNFTASMTYDNQTYQDIYTKTGGEFFVESRGNISELPINLLKTINRIIWGGNRDYGDTPVINRQMPNVPSAPNGSLDNTRGGQSVTAQNLNAFFNAFILEMDGDDDYFAKTRGTESTSSFESVEHGNENGYFVVKGNETSKRNNSGNFNAGTQTVEFFDYSNFGSLFFGGGTGGANTYEWSDGSSWEKDEYVLNGNVRFNGEFSGTLEFRNFRYKYEYGSNISSSDMYQRVSGDVFIGTLKVTDEYMDRVVKGNSGGPTPPPPPNPGPSVDMALIVNSANQAWTDAHEYESGNRDGIQLLNDGTFLWISDYPDGVWTAFEEEGGTWTLNGNLVMLNYYDGYEEHYPISVLSNDRINLDGLELTRTEVGEVYIISGNDYFANGATRSARSAASREKRAQKINLKR